MHRPRLTVAEQPSPRTSPSAVRPRVLVVATGRDRGALAAVRAFSAAGWYVGVGTPEGGGVLGSSRACDVTYRVPRPRHDGTAFVDGVRRAVSAGGFDLVFGGGDDWMAALSAYRSQLPLPVAHPAFDVVETILDKVRLAEYAQKAGITSPHTELASDQALADWQGPVVVKCKEHWAPNQTRPLRIEAKLFATAADACPQVERIRASGAQPILQAPVDGSLGALVGVFHDGRLHGRTQQESTRLWPTPNGASARARTVPVDEELAARVEAMLLELGWHGLVELQFLTGDDGVPYLIDFNGRFYGSLALAESAGHGLVRMWGELTLGLEPPALPDATPGKRYSWFAGDLRRARRERRGGLVRDVADTLRWSLTARHSTWDVTDPRPSVALALGRLRRH
ncbi:hypothetical protein PTW37_14615 [Arthrobacter agilis]|uniref:carboxylate--amine ligase n=1 Tax=Arthrobacter agilis TaxID=37921 RepID=UPI002366761B|nr:hypothetical protein [Arthrobacter agilis]WDF33064.1 hypothetical protein PTW37_14615 [Arthrobacter agilis]